jgi:cation channel sperm-associated protein 2
MKVMDPGLACVYFLTWLLLGTFIFKNIFAGVMVNNFQNIRQELVDETNEISNKSKLFRDFDVRIEALEEEMRIPDNQADWETRVFHLLDLLKVAEGQLSPSLWPRDTLFHYYVILEALGNNISERDELLNILNEGLLHHYMA